ncbi:hypothetical protein [Nonomuraea corallina]|uniref:hypothetical protein n=1 Tax=Nonomuraea corallina TaxID=2989783 RepID=UPI0038CD8173
MGRVTFRSNPAGIFQVCPSSRSTPTTTCRSRRSGSSTARRAGSGSTSGCWSRGGPVAPLLERVRFLAVFGGNLDEFFRVRIAGLKRRMATGLLLRTKSGLKPIEEPARIATVVLGEQGRHLTGQVGQDGVAGGARLDVGARGARAGRAARRRRRAARARRRAARRAGRGAGP